MIDYLSTLHSAAQPPVYVMSDKNVFSTDDFDQQRFRPHGRVKFYREGNLAICEAIGPFNTELVEAIGRAEMQLIEQMKQLPKWGDIVIIKDNALASPDAMDELTNYLIQLGRADMHSAVTAMVIGEDVVGGAIMANHLVNVYADAGLPLHVFTTLADAKVYVKLLL